MGGDQHCCHHEEELRVTREELSQTEELLKDLLDQLVEKEQAVKALEVDLMEVIVEKSELEAKVKEQTERGDERELPRLRAKLERYELGILVHARQLQRLVD